MEITDCFGSPAQRGHSHGENLRDRIKSALEHWESATMKALGARAPSDIDAYCTRFLDATRLMQRVQTTTPDLYAELAGIAEGAGQPLNRIAAYNLMDEQWWHDTSPAAAPPGCSLVGAVVEGGHVMAQNMDLPAHMEGSQVVLRLGGPDMPQTILLSAAGQIGLTGANEAGLAIGVNTLLMLNHAADGLPVAFVLRHALGAGDRAAALARLSGVDHASGQHYAMVTKDGMTSAECSANGCAQLPIEKDRPLLHTNHPLISTDVNAAAQSRLGTAGFNNSSKDRLAWLETRRSACSTADAVQSLFDDDKAPICMRAQTNGGSSTFASVLYEMTDSVTVRMRNGIAGSAEWQSIAFV